MTLWGLGLACLLLVASAGCLFVPTDDDGPRGSDALKPSSGVDDQDLVLPSLGPQIILDIGGGTIQEFDVLCAMGGGPRLPRADGIILPGTRQLDVSIDVEGLQEGIHIGVVGVQLGYVVLDDAADAGDGETSQEGITWSDTITGGPGGRFTIPVAPGDTEDPAGPLRWAFYERMNVAAAPQDCYTGAFYGKYSIVVMTGT